MKKKVLLMDVVMPKMDGLAACRALRELPSTRATPIILVTTRGEPFNVEAGYSSGCSDYVTKPVDGAELLEKVAVYLEHRRRLHPADPRRPRHRSTLDGTVRLRVL
jgi:CheY-like chemotaxis protein